MPKEPIANDTNSSEGFDINSLSDTIINTDVDDAFMNNSNGSGSEGEKDDAPGSEGAPDGKDVNIDDSPKSLEGEEKPAETQEGKKGENPDESEIGKPTPESRLSDAQRKIHEQSTQIKQMERAVANMKSQADSKQVEVFDAILKNIKNQNAPKAPSQEEVVARFNKLAEESPMEAINLLIQNAQEAANNSKSDDLNKTLDKFKNDIIASNNVNYENVRINSNLENMAKNKPEFNGAFDSFRDYLWNTYGLLGDNAITERSVKAVCADPAKLNSHYDSFLVATKGEAVKSAAAATNEALIAEKLSQNQGSNGVAAPKGKGQSNMILEEITPGFAGFFRQ